MVREILAETEERMQKALEAFRRELGGIRAGRASAALVERVRVDYYGAPTPIPQLANVSTPEARLLVIQPWDKGMVGPIEKAILKSDLGLTPQVDGSVIRLAIPPLTEERRNELIRTVRKAAEEQRVAIRNLRREANDRLRDLAKRGEIPEDEARRGEEQVQKRTDRFVSEIDAALEAKERELREV